MTEPPYMDTDHQGMFWAEQNKCDGIRTSWPWQWYPCGGCLDWIFRFGGPECVVSFQGEEGVAIQSWRAGDLMPHYPK